MTEKADPEPPVQRLILAEEDALEKYSITRPLAVKWKGRKWIIRGNEKIGSSSTDCDICVNDSSVSKVHADIVRDSSGNFALSPVDQTFLRLDSRSATDPLAIIKNGATVRIGVNTVLKIHDLQLIRDQGHFIEPVYDIMAEKSRSLMLKRVECRVQKRVVFVGAVADDGEVCDLTKTKLRSETNTSEVCFSETVLRAKVEVLEGPDEDVGRVFRCISPTGIYIGSDPACGVFLEHDGIAPVHCKIDVNDERRFFLKDVSLSSTTATKIEICGQHLLREGDVCQCGSSLFHFVSLKQANFEEAWSGLALKISRIRSAKDADSPTGKYDPYYVEVPREGALVGSGESCHVLLKAINAVRVHAKLDRLPNNRYSFENCARADALVRMRQQKGSAVQASLYGRKVPLRKGDCFKVGNCKFRVMGIHARAPGEAERTNFEEKMQTFRCSKLFANLPQRVIEKCAKLSYRIVFPARERIIRAGREALDFYLIKSGRAESTVGRIGKTTELYPGDHFGAVSLLYRSPVLATIKTHTRMECYAIDKKAFVLLCEPVLKDYVYARSWQLERMERRSLLRQFAWLRPLPDNLLSMISDKLTMRTFIDCDRVIAEKQRDGPVCFILSGKAILSRGTCCFSEALSSHHSSLKAGKYFGVDQLHGQPSKVSIDAASVLRVVVLPKKLILQILAEFYSADATDSSEDDDDAERPSSTVTQLWAASESEAEPHTPVANDVEVSPFDSSPFCCSPMNPLRLEDYARGMKVLNSRADRLDEDSQKILTKCLRYCFSRDIRALEAEPGGGAVFQRPIYECFLLFGESFAERTVSQWIETSLRKEEIRDREKRRSERLFSTRFGSAEYRDSDDDDRADLVKISSAMQMACAESEKIIEHVKAAGQRRATICVELDEESLSHQPHFITLRAEAGMLGVFVARFAAPLVSFGRDPSNTVVIEDPRLALHHCAIEFEKGTYYLRDFGGALGTFQILNRGAAVLEVFLICFAGQRAPLNMGSEFSIGNTSLQVLGALEPREKRQTGCVLV